MGQATQAAAAIDLPDPTEAGAGTGAGADDLLAQLAGDEIDRLLAEAEVERPSTVIEDTRTVTNVARAGDDDDALLPSDAFQPTGPADGVTGEAFVAAKPADGTTGDAFVAAKPADGTIVRGGTGVGESDSGGTILAAAEAAAADDPALSQELDAVFANLDAKAAPPSPPRPPAPSGVLDQLTPGHFPQVRTTTAPPVARDPDEADTSAAERAALDLDAELEESAAQVVQAAVAKAEAGPADSSGDGDRVPFYIRLLEWINAPLAACSDATRELIGKIAVLTLVNAIAVLVYVLFVR